MKRACDLTIAALAIVALFPILAIVAALVWLSDRGSIFYHGERIGRQGAPFKMLKFRTMRIRPAEGAAITVRDDPRVTPVGRVLRKLKLDELPQLINVARGEMSLVGPRPEAPRYVALYTSEQRRVLTVRPGVTGLTQIVYRDESQFLSGSDPDTLYRTVVMPAKLRIDLEYIAHVSLWLDASIIMLTAIVILIPPASSLARFLVPTSADVSQGMLEPAHGAAEPEPVAPRSRKERNG
ncbi:MAG TPA: sugar transferase [Ktedonobacterales bacterium]